MESRKNHRFIRDIVKQQTKIIVILESFFATWAIMRVGKLSSTNIIAFLFFGLCYSFFTRVKKRQNC